jgi:hypothetical protein
MLGGQIDGRLSHPVEHLPAPGEGVPGNQVTGGGQLAARLAVGIVRDNVTTVIPQEGDGGFGQREGCVHGWIVAERGRGVKAGKAFIA